MTSALLDGGYDLATMPRTRRTLVSIPAEDPPAPSALTVTVQINLNGQLPAAAEGLLESLRALAGSSGVVVREISTADPDPYPVSPAPRGPLRPRLLRRSGDPLAGGSSLRIYPASRMVLRDGIPVELTRREYDLLVFLCEHPRRVFSRGQLLRYVWGYDLVSGERTVDVHVRRIRVKLGERRPLIATVRGVGYRLDDAAEVTIVADQD